MIIHNDKDVPLTSSGIYCITFKESSRKYVGQTKVFGKRLKQHLRELQKNIHFNDILQRSFNKYGIESFVFIILEECGEMELSQREIYWAEVYKDYLMNLGQVGCNIPMSDLTKNKIREKAVGRRHSMETRKKISEVQIGKVGQKGKKLSKEQYLKMSIKRKGIKPKITQEQKQKGVAIRRVWLDNKTSGLNYELAKKIKELLPLYPPSVIAKMLNVSYSMVSNIKSGLAWKHVHVDIPEEYKNCRPKKPGSFGMLGKRFNLKEETRERMLLKRRHNINSLNNLTIEEVIEIKNLFSTPLSNVDIAKKYSVTKSTIRSIRIERTWKGSVEYFENLLKEIKT